MFSTKNTAERSLPSMLGGGDLDGDEYQICLDERLIPRKAAIPAAYPPAPKLKLNRPVVISDIQSFVVDFINNDILGQISVTHLLYADISAFGVYDPKCLKMAELASKAVDFLKSGTSVQQNELPRYRIPLKPDFMVFHLLITGT